MTTTLENQNPTIHENNTPRRDTSAADYDDDIEDVVDAMEIYGIPLDQQLTVDLIREINDPEHPVNHQRCIYNFSLHWNS